MSSNWHVHRKPDHVSKEFSAFVSRCLKKSPEERASVEDLLTDPFLKTAEYKKHYLMPLINEAIQIKRQKVGSSIFM